jgi:hypothetical protein
LIAQLKRVLRISPKRRAPRYMLVHYLETIVAEALSVNELVTFYTQGLWITLWIIFAAPCVA